jgi:hypothetical protein
MASSNPTNAVFLLSFCLAFLGGFGLEAFQRLNLKGRVIFLGVFVSLFSLLLFLVFFSHQGISARNLVYTGGIFFLFLILFFLYQLVKSKKIIIFSFIVLSIFDMFYFFQKFNPFVPSELVFPNTPILSFLQRETNTERFWGYQAAGIDANFATQYRIFSPEGYDPLYPNLYGQFLQGTKDGRLGRNFSLSTRSDARISQDGDLASNPYRLKVLDLLGVGYILDRVENKISKESLDVNRFEIVYNSLGWKIYKNKKALPRAYLFDDYKVAKSASEFEKIFFDKDFDPAKTVILPEELPGDIFLSKKDGTIKILSYEPNTVRIEAKTENPTILFLSDTYFPGWHALVNGKETKIYRADYAFRAILLPKGRSHIVFQFIPQSFKKGAKISIISVIGLLMSLALIRKKRIFYER